MTALTIIHRAPGGYSAAVLKVHPEAEVFGLTLPKADGGVRSPPSVNLLLDSIMSRAVQEV